MEILQLLVTSFTVALSGAAAPGPLMFTTIKESYVSGVKAGLLLSLGHALVEVPAVVILGLGMVNLQGGMTLPILYLCGGSLLIVLGLLTLKDAIILKVAIQSSKVNESSKLRQLFLGAASSISNPYWSIWWATVGAAYVLSSLELSVLGIVLFYFSHIFADFAVFTTISFAVSKGKDMLGTKSYRLVLAVSGFALLLISAVFLLEGTTRFIAL
ncbi:MAG: LysE family transporter [Candidatus Bathyarchaeia archaeon]